MLSILLITYKREYHAKRTINGLLKHLHYPAPWHWHIADDGSGIDYIGKLASIIANERAQHGDAITYTDTQRRGVGASMNMGQQVCFSKNDIILWLEDDWELNQDLDLVPLVEFLEQRTDFGMIRLGYLQRGIRAETFGHNGYLYWHLRKNSPDGYIFAGHANLRHKRFYEAYGAYNESSNPGNTEADMAYRYRTSSGPEIVWPAWVGSWGVFGHIGGSSLAHVEPYTEPTFNEERWAK